MLQKLEVEVIQATSGAEALQLALEHEFFAAIVDVQMPEMDGYELVELLRGNESPKPCRSFSSAPSTPTNTTTAKATRPAR